MDDPHVGKTYGNVRMEARIGQGAMGVVYRGWHLHFDRQVAVKILLQQRASSHARERFLREGQAAAKIQHENVVQVLDAGEHKGVTYLVMEFVDGYSLGRILDDTGPLPPEAVARLGAGICLGLAAIHAKGIIHRDIKPDNILVGSDRRPKITDLGLAKQTDDPALNRLTATGMVVGTPLYVAPENIRDPKASTAAIDIYSLGATLYHMLSGKPPFTASTPYEVMRAHLEYRPQPLRELRPDIPGGLAQLVEQCLHKSPERRPTALALAELLSQGSGLKVAANRGFALLIGIACVVVMGGAALGWLGLHTSHAGALAQQTQIQVDLHADRPDARVAIDYGTWNALPSTGLTLAITPGHHHLSVQSSMPGPLYSWETDIEARTHQDRLDLTAALVQCPIASQRLMVPGDGLLFCDGSAYGMEPSLTVTRAGTYALAHWDGKTWHALTLRVDARGQVHSTAQAERSLPEGDAYWRRGDDSGATLLRHHLVSWWEAELARTRSDLAPPPGWLLQGEHPEQPAMGMSTDIIAAMRRVLGAVASELPDREQAGRLAALYQAPIWCQDAGHLDFVGGGGPRTALLVLLPGASTPAP